MIDFGNVLADPPWRFSNRFGAGSPADEWNPDATRGAAKHYRTLKLQEICDLKPPVAKDAVLLIWTVSSHMDETLKVIDAWGFKLKTKAWTWVKTGRFWQPIYGMGFWTRHATEDCWLATRGKPPRPDDKGVGDLIFAPRRKHSQKPDEQYVKIDRLLPANVYGPRLEMFARHRHDESWSVFGNQVEDSITLERAL